MVISTTVNILMVNSVFSVSSYNEPSCTTFPRGMSDINYLTKDNYIVKCNLDWLGEAMHILRMEIILSLDLVLSTCFYLEIFC